MLTIQKPTFVVDQKKTEKNISLMKARIKKVPGFRPHFKTHQSLEIGRWLKQGGVGKVTVSSVEMAEYFASEWDDIAIAFPVNPREIDKINQLAGQINLTLLVESIEVCEFLARSLTSPVNFYIKIDVGSNRTGLNPDNTDTISGILLIAWSTKKLRFTGFLAHAGHTYQAKSTDEVIAIHDHSCRIITGLKDRFRPGYPSLIASIGDTPSCSIATHFEGIDEVRPGNFVFYDLMQQRLSTCKTDQIACAVACPVVSVHSERNELVIYGGAVHFSKDSLPHPKFGCIYGQVAETKAAGWGNAIDYMYLVRLSQEHGIVHVPGNLIGKYKPGDILYVLPVHSCLTANQFRRYLTTSGAWIDTM